MWCHRPSFRVTLQCASRIIQLRDQLSGRGAARTAETPGLAVTRHSIVSGSSVLDAVYVEPHTRRASVLICHGIGEIAPQWFPIQRILAEVAVASLVFDYSGYGRSTGRPEWTQLEQDAIAAFHLLEQLAQTGPRNLLGFSLGTGIVPKIAQQVKADRLVLCAGFPSFRAAARAVGVPAFLSPLVPDIWNAEDSLPGCKLPVLVVHSTTDGLFPVCMAHEIASLCGGKAEVLLVPGLGHNEPFYDPQLSYWEPIGAFLVS